MKGKIARVYTDKRFGFIRGEDKNDYFFHASAILNAPTVTDEDFKNLLHSHVEFDETETPKGKRAESVYLS